MRVGTFTMSEIEELFVLEDEYEINGCTTLYTLAFKHFKLREE